MKKALLLASLAAVLRQEAVDPSAEGASSGGGSAAPATVSTHTVSSPSGQTTVTVSGSHPRLHAIATVFEKLLPVVEAGAAPFIKSEGAIQITNTEAPILEELFGALANL